MSSERSSDNAFDIAAVLTNDSDLALPIRMVRDRFGKTVVLVGYDRRLLQRRGRKPRPPNRQLRESVSAFKVLRESHLELSLFPREMQDEKGKLSKPREW